MPAGPVCVLGHFFQISLAQLLLLRQAAFFPLAQLLENLRKNKINKQRNGALTYYFWRQNLDYWRALRWLKI